MLLLQKVVVQISLWTNKFIFGYWVSNGSIKIRISERSPVKVISHIVDLEKLFPDNPLLKDDHDDGYDYFEPFPVSRHKRRKILFFKKTNCSIFVYFGE